MARLVHRQVARRLGRILTQVQRAVGLHQIPEQRAVFVFGCQRSGTTMLLEALERDPRAEVFHEYDGRLFSALRLRGKDERKRVLDRYQSQLVVAKPLLDSQHAQSLLAQSDNTTAVWLYRHYRSVASSNVLAFGPKAFERDIKPVLACQSDDWRADSVSGQTCERVVELARHCVSPRDAAALFWFTRNSLLFDQGLHTHGKVVVMSYESFVSAPVSALQHLYARIGVSYPRVAIERGIHGKVAGRGRDEPLTREIEAACKQIWEALEACAAS